MPPTTLAPTGAQASQDRDALLTPAALSFLAELHTAFAHRRTPLLEERRTRSALLARGAPLDFLPATQAVRQDRTWHIAPPAPGLADRRTELTTPPTRAAAKAALTSGAQLWTADFEDATSPSWPNILTGHLTLLDLVEGRLTAPEGHTAPTVAVRPRGWHLTERHLLVDGDPLPPPWPTSASTPSTGPAAAPPPPTARTSPSPSWRTTARPASGTRSSPSPSAPSASPTAPSAPRS
ncbi:malate synthase [Streptomyces sp. BvitLS-983]|nr:malate synthase [Streptomyces sp. BvitLS-983]